MHRSASWYFIVTSPLFVYFITFRITQIPAFIFCFLLLSLQLPNMCHSIFSPRAKCRKPICLAASISRRFRPVHSPSLQFFSPYNSPASRFIPSFPFPCLFTGLSFHLHTTLRIPAVVLTSFPNSNFTNVRSQIRKFLKCPEKHATFHFPREFRTERLQIDWSETRASIIYHLSMQF